MKKLEKKYGLLVASSMVVGVVIGSGVFFKADDVLNYTEGNIILALLAWGLGAFAMIFGALVFAEFAGRIEKANGIVDYAEAAYGKKFGYMVGWFKGVLYFAPLSAVIGWVAALYTLILLGVNQPENRWQTWLLAFIYIIGTYAVNYFAPVLAGKFQVTTTFIKLIPIALVGVAGLIYGVFNQITISNFSIATDSFIEKSGSLSAAVVATAFAYEGWVSALTINSEIKDSSKNLPKALTLGAFIVFGAYVLYFMGITSVLPAEVIMLQGDASVMTVANALFGTGGATLLTVFVVISVLGTLNGLILSCIRMPFALAIRHQGPFHQRMAKIHPRSLMPRFATVYSLVLTLGYLLVWYGSLNGWYGRFVDLGEIPIVLIYVLYIFLYIWYMIHFKELSVWKRYIKPILATLGALVIIYGGITKPSIGVYMLISVVVVAAGLFFYRSEREQEEGQTKK